MRHVLQTLHVALRVTNLHRKISHLLVEIGHSPTVIGPLKYPHLGKQIRKYTMAGTTRQHVFIFSSCHTFPGLVLCLLHRVILTSNLPTIHNFSSPSNKTCIFISTKLPPYQTCSHGKAYKQ